MASEKVQVANELLWRHRAAEPEARSRTRPAVRGGPTERAQWFLSDTDRAGTMTESRTSHGYVWVGVRGSGVMW